MSPNDPAFPQEAKRFHDSECFGLTKRQYIAIEMMKVSILNDGHDSDVSLKDHANYACLATEALLERLQRD